DFGLVAELGRADSQRSTEGLVLGTAAYMAPEQAACRALTPAADWYSVGVILYEALTGGRPLPRGATQGPDGYHSLVPPPPAAAPGGGRGSRRPGRAVRGAAAPGAGGPPGR